MARPSASSADASAGVASKRGVPTDEEHRLIRDLRDQLNRMRQDLIRVKAHADVSVSKATRALECEEYLIQEMKNLSAELECKCFVLIPSPRVFEHLGDEG